MSDAEHLDERVRAIERTLTDGDVSLPELEPHADLLERLDALEARAETIERRLDELDAATQALRGYVGNVRSVNRDVERRADAALAAVESLEAERESEPVGPDLGPPAPPELAEDDPGDDDAEDGLLSRVRDSI